MRILITFLLLYAGDLLACKGTSDSIVNYISSASVTTVDEKRERYTIAFKRLINEPSKFYVDHAYVILNDDNGDTMISSELSFNDVAHNESVSSFLIAKNVIENAKIYLHLSYPNKVELDKEGSYGVIRLACYDSREYKLKELKIFETK